jgi:hypothetical protein
VIRAAMLLALGPAASAAPEAIEAAATAELERARSLSLPGQATPWYIAIDVTEGRMSTAVADLGELTFFDSSPWRFARTEVRVGSRELDNAGFRGGYGDREGVTMRGLPLGDDTLALRRELWLALDAAYKGAAEQLSARLAAREGRSPDPEAPPSWSEEPPLQTPPVTLADLVAEDGPSLARARAASAPLAGVPWLEEGTATVRDIDGRRLLVNTEGARVWTPARSSALTVEAVARADDGQPLRGVRQWVALEPADLPSPEEMAAELDRMVQALDAQRAAPVLRDYLGPVLFEGPAAVELFRQLLPAELSGTPPGEQAPDPYGASSPPPPGARIGRRLLPRGWAVVDDPRRPGGDRPPVYEIDHEGVPAQRVELVRDGVLVHVLMSRTPRAGVLRSTGHGRALGAEVRAAMTGAVTVTPPREAREARLRREALVLARQAGLDHVLVIRQLTPPALEEEFEVAFTGEGPLSGLTRPLDAIRLYPDGREEPVRGLRFVGVDRRALRDIAMAGAVQPPVMLLDMPPGPARFGVGPVGGLPTTWAVPPVLITELELRGSPGTQRRALPAP